MGIANLDSWSLSGHDVPMTGFTSNPFVLNCISLNLVECAFGDCIYRSILHWATRRLMTERPVKVSEAANNLKEKKEPNRTKARH
ncbi:hypothetical protein TNCV_2756701 [Trichonephila clavipes]|nr:hypothetical protein TNCV_2756701 [Trichonephila clavipes]